MPVEVGRHRKHGDNDVFIRESEAFHVRVREGYHYLAAAEPARWLVLDGSRPAEEVAAKVWDQVRPRVSL